MKKPNIIILLLLTLPIIIATDYYPTTVIMQLNGTGSWGNYTLDLAGDTGTGVILDAETFSIVGANGIFTYMDGNTLTINKTNQTVGGSVDYSLVQNWSTSECPANNYAYTRLQNGTFLCREDSDTDTTCNGNTCEVTNTGTLDGYEGSDLLDDTNETIRFNNLVGTNCTAGDYVSGHQTDGTVVCGTPTGSSGGLNLSQIHNITFGLIVGATSGTYDGNLSNSTHIGYTRGHALCLQEYANSHFCMEAEILKSNELGTYHGLSDTYWYAVGAPGYTAEANSCGGHTDDSSTSLGAFWRYNLGGVGHGKLVNCAQTKALLCCG